MVAAGRGGGCLVQPRVGHWRRARTTAVWLGTFGSGGGIPPGCPAIDPLPEPTAFAPHGQFRSSVSYLVPSGCTSSQLQITVEFEQGGTVLAERTAELAIIAAPATAG
jgi:hypothetical protein